MRNWPLIAVGLALMLCACAGAGRETGGLEKEGDSPPRLVPRRMMDPGQHQMFPDNSIEVSLPEGAIPTTTRATFNHENHTEMLCGYCHHAFFVGDVITKRRTYFEKEVHGYDKAMVALIVPHEGSYSCSQDQCHTDMTSKTGEGSYYAAFHSSEGGSCMNCHLEEKEAGGNSNVPVECQDCHKPG